MAPRRCDHLSDYLLSTTTSTYTLLGKRRTAALLPRRHKFKRIAAIIVPDFELRTMIWGQLPRLGGKDDDAPRLEDVIAALLIVAGMCWWQDCIPTLVLTSCLLMIVRRNVALLLAWVRRHQLAYLGCEEELQLHRPLRLVAVVVQDTAAVV